MPSEVRQRLDQLSVAELRTLCDRLLSELDEAVPHPRTRIEEEDRNLFLMYDHMCTTAREFGFFGGDDNEEDPDGRDL